ncbi:MAG: hypothetical protein LAT80_00825 [Balneolaceae bacterium]|nr:hypothetical protein [Balneolaceae bacterium]
MARIKKAQDLNEDISIRNVKLHFHRFSRFLRYLKENDAVIELSVESGSADQKYQQVYTARKRDGNPSIEDLVSDALNISGSMARDYTNRKLGLDDRHSDADKIYATGQVIDAITMYLNSDGPKDEENQRLLSKQLFSNRKGGVQTPWEFHKQFNPFGLKKKTDRSIYLLSEFKSFQDNIVLALQAIPTVIVDLSHRNDPSVLFSTLLKELRAIYGDRLAPSFKTGSFGLIRSLKRIEQYYTDFQHSDNPDQLLFPGYIDFTIPHSKNLALSSSNSIFSEKLTAQHIRDLTLEETILYRYEILWSILEEDIPLSECGTFVHAVLLLTDSESLAFELLITDAVEKILQDLRFVIYYSDLHHGPNLQQDSLTLADLSEILSRYNFRNGLENSIEISGSNLLNTSILKFPEPHIAKGGYPPLVVEGLFKKALGEHFAQRVKQDLIISSNSW